MLQGELILVLVRGLAQMTFKDPFNSQITLILRVVIIIYYIIPYMKISNSL